MTKKKNKDENKKDETKEIIKRRRHILCSSSSSFRPAYYFRPASRRFPQEYFSVCVCVLCVQVPVTWLRPSRLNQPHQPQVQHNRKWHPLPARSENFFQMKTKWTNFFFFRTHPKNPEAKPEVPSTSGQSPPPREINRPSERIFSDWSQKFKKQTRKWRWLPVGPNRKWTPRKEKNTGSWRGMVARRCLWTDWTAILFDFPNRKSSTLPYLNVTSRICIRMFATTVVYYYYHYYYHYYYYYYYYYYHYYYQFWPPFSHPTPCLPPCLPSGIFSWENSLEYFLEPRWPRPPARPAHPARHLTWLSYFEFIFSWLWFNGDSYPTSSSPSSSSSSSSHLHNYFSPKIKE